MNRIAPLSAPAAPIMTREDVRRRAGDLIPALRERAAEAENLRRCPDATIADYVASDLLAVCMPARYGGSELPYDIYCDAVHTLARGDASQAWVYMVLADNALKLTSFSKQAQDEVWGKDPRARLSNAVAPVGKGKPVDGGVLWSGRHGFSSGVDHAQWVMCAGHIEHADGRRQGVNVLVPRSDITIVDDWQVMGLSGSGSKTFVVDGAFVPEHRIVDKEASDAGEVPGLEGYDAPVFHMPRGGISTCSYTAVAVGAAEAMLEEYLRYTSPRKSRGTVVAEQTGTQMVVGQSSAEIEAATRMYLSPVREAMEKMERGETVSRAEVLHGRRNAAYAAQLAITATQRLFNAAGGRALYNDSPLQRIFRDCYAASAHHALMWDTAAAGYGRILLGVKGSSAH
ncbi:MAG TPA: acyl-CoA dehydrogenase family protein [Xanthobacteraceae bacterium]|nr:acyl-CoA dehydrogenase family protein [Xanthobacteraceae bacterium]